MALPAEGGGTPGTMIDADWWVFRLPPAGGTASKDSGAGWTYSSMQADNRAIAERAATDRGGTVVAGPFGTQEKANGYITQRNLPRPFSGTTAPNILGDINPVQWLTQKTGGVLAGALEAGFVAVVKDIWNVIVGPALIFLGVAIAVVVLVIFFKDDIAEGAALAAKVVK